MTNRTKNLAGKDLRYVNVSNEELRAADLSNCTLEGAWLRGVDLADADLTEADLRRAHLEGANLAGANLQNADLTGADVRGAKIEQAAALNGVDLTNAKGVPAPLEATKTPETTPRRHRTAADDDRNAVTPSSAKKHNG